MTYINIYIPKLSELKERLAENPKLIEYYIKYEGWTGDSDSIDYLDEMVREHIKNKIK
jgi:transcriptional regulator with AAA-type ATPase domain